MALSDSDAQAHLCAMQTAWSVLFGALAVVLVAGISLGPLWDAPLSAIATALFYANAFLNLAALLWAFAVQYYARDVVARTPDLAARLGVVARHGRRAATVLAGAGFFAVGAAVGSGEWINVAFLVPIFGFAILFFPTRGRLERIIQPGLDRGTS